MVFKSFKYRLNETGKIETTNKKRITKCYQVTKAIVTECFKALWYCQKSLAYGPIGRTTDRWSNGSSNIFTDRQTERPSYRDALLQNAKKIVKHVVNCS